MAIRSYYLTPEGNIQCELREEEVRAAFESKAGLLWVDIHRTSEEDGEFLARDFGFHHLAVEDCMSPMIHPPKIDDFGTYLFLIVHGINHAVESDVVETAELAIFLGPGFVVSSHDDPLYSVDSVARLVEDDGRPMKRGADFLAYTIMDALIDNILPTVDRMSDFADEIEEEVIRSPQPSILDEIMKLKRSVLRLHRVMAPQREVLNRLSRREFTIVGDEAQIFYRDVYDHIVRIEDLGQMLRDRADNALATHLSSVANRQNETMRILAIVAAIFMPLTLLAGIYGMNFGYMPELGWHWAYFAVVGVIGAVVVTSVAVLTARRWLAWSRRMRRVRPFAVEPDRLMGYIGQMAKLPHLRL